jgi:hypothetical protein
MVCKPPSLLAEASLPCPFREYLLYYSETQWRGERLQWAHRVHVSAHPTEQNRNPKVETQ